jgi:hypothetical protein
MPQLLIEAGSLDVHSVVRGAQIALADKPISLERLPSGRTHELKYEPTLRPWRQLEQELRSGVTTSVRLLSTSQALSWGLIFAPRFDETGPPWWKLVIELRTTHYDTTYQALKEIEGIAYVVVSNEDTLDLDAESIAPDRFPWNDERLVRAAVRDSIEGYGSWNEQAAPSK